MTATVPLVLSFEILTSWLVDVVPFTAYVTVTFSLLDTFVFVSVTVYVPYVNESKLYVYVPSLNVNSFSLTVFEYSFGPVMLNVIFSRSSSFTVCPLNVFVSVNAPSDVYAFVIFIVFVLFSLTVICCVSVSFTL